MFKNKFLELGISEISLDRKLAEFGLTQADLEQVKPEHEGVIHSLYDYFLSCSDVVRTGQALERKKMVDLGAYSSLQYDLTKVYRIVLIDTCCIVDKNSTFFFQALEAILEKLEKSSEKPVIYILEDVKRELLNLKERFLNQEKFAAREQIKENLDILYRLKEKGYIREVPRLYQSEGQKKFLADLELFQIYDREINRRGGKSILILTNDNALQFDFYQRFARLSVVPTYFDKEANHEKPRKLKNKLAKIKNGKYITICESDHYNLTISDIDFKKYLAQSLYFKQAEVAFLSELITGDFFNPDKWKEHRHKKHQLKLRDQATGSHLIPKQ